MNLRENKDKDKRPLVANPGIIRTDGDCLKCPIYHLFLLPVDAFMCAGLDMSPDWTDVPSGVYVDHRDPDGGDRRMFPAARRGRRDPSKKCLGRDGRSIIRRPLSDAFSDTPLSPPQGEKRSHLR